MKKFAVVVALLFTTRAAEGQSTPRFTFPLCPESSQADVPYYFSYPVAYYPPVENVHGQMVFDPLFCEFLGGTPETLTAAGCTESTGEETTCCESRTVPRYGGTVKHTYRVFSCVDATLQPPQRNCVFHDFYQTFAPDDSPCATLYKLVGPNYTNFTSP